MSDAIHATSPALPNPGHPHSPDNFFAKKIGPMPVWAYALILAGMLAIGFWYKSHKAATAGTGTVTSNGTTGDSLDGEESADGYVANSGTDSYGTSSGSSSSGSSATLTTTNAEWASNAANYLDSVGGDPVAIQTALADYLAGQQLTSAQTTIVNQAIAAVGSPPQGVIPVATSSPSVNYTVVSGDSLVSIAQMFYGDSSKWQTIYAANIGVIGKDPLALHHGETLTLPGQGLLATPAAGISSQAIPSNHTYTIQYGDTGIQIAKKFYGDANEWPKIYALNKSKIPNQNELVAGTVIKLP